MSSTLDLHQSIIGCPMYEGSTGSPNNRRVKKHNERNQPKASKIRDDVFC